MSDNHPELIICPECKSRQKATVDHTFPFWSYVHVCTECEYIIMESEWELAETGEKKFREAIEARRK